MRKRRYLDPDLVRSTTATGGRFGDNRYCKPVEVARGRWAADRVDARYATVRLVTDR
jgi:hypothetical protein